MPLPNKTWSGSKPIRKLYRVCWIQIWWGDNLLHNVAILFTNWGTYYKVGQALLENSAASCYYKEGKSY